MENKIIYDEIMDAVYINIPLDIHEQKIVERYKQLYFLYYDYRVLPPNPYTYYKEVRNIKSEMNSLISTETIQKLLRTKREQELEKWNKLYEYLDAQ